MTLYIMASVTVYLSREVYRELMRIADKENKTDSKMAQKIIKEKLGFDGEEE